MNFACPLNAVSQPARIAFWERNPRIRNAWKPQR